jgi:ATP-dependent DNA helicase RecQ
MDQDPARLELDRVLQQQFGLPAFRGLQRPVIEAVLAGRDVLALLPTGGGKSLCYQLPALLLPGLTVVVSPLIALIRDQQRRLAALGIPGCALAGEWRAADRRALAEALRLGRLRVLLVSPERLLGGNTLDWLVGIVGSQGVSLLVVDEAHCIADWGESFRPAYRALGRIRMAFPQAPVLALTASADASAQRTILSSLGMPVDAILQAGFDRPELFYRVLHSVSPWRQGLAFLQQHHPAASAIFYCQRRWEADAVARFLRRHGVPAAAYHAGLSADRRRRAEHWFAAHPGAVMAATIAFGMGIDKPDIRLVAHFGVARNLAAYYQESGRAGRDGAPADALLVLDRALWPDPGLPDCAGSAADPGCGAPAAHPLAPYVESRACRRLALLAALGQSYAPPCGSCDRCAPGERRVPQLRSSELRWVPLRRGLRI